MSTDPSEETRDRKARRTWRSPHRIRSHRTRPACPRSRRCCASEDRHDSGGLDLDFRAPKATGRAALTLVALPGEGPRQLAPRRFRALQVRDEGLLNLALQCL